MKKYKVTVDYDGTTKWYNLKGQLHRVGGPAMKNSNGDKFWFIEGLLHREDGHAIEFADGDKVWYLEGKKYTETEYHKKLHADVCEGKVVEIDGKRYKLTGV